MKSLTNLSKILLFLTIVSFVCLIVDFLTLTDIYHDYVSKTTINRFAPQALNTLPDWTNTKGEWSAANISYFTRLIITMMTFIFLIISGKKILKLQQK